jgi:lipopolysaccharide export system protein LptA
MSVMIKSGPILAAALALSALTPLAAQAQTQTQQRVSSGNNTSTPLANLGGDSKDPIKIDADRLDVRDRESMAVFSGNVVAVQGKSTIRCSRMTIVYENRQQPGVQRTSAAAAAAAPSAPGGGNNAIKRLECAGPVTVTSDDQVATGNNAVFDRERDLVTLTGAVALAKGPNVTRGERLVYNIKTGVANIESGAGQRVQGFFVPGSADAPTPAPQRPRPQPNGQPQAQR